MLLGDGGDDTLNGGGGADLFRFRRGDGEDLIKGFKPGKDAIEFLSGASSFEDLTLTRDGADTVIDYGKAGDMIVLQGVRPAQLDEDDFMF